MNDSSDSGSSSGDSRAGGPSSGETRGGGDAEDGLRPRRGCEIDLQNPNRYPGVETAELRPWLAAVVAELAPGAATFAALFCGDRAMRRTNREYRGFDKTTDVLSFRGNLPPAAAAAGASSPEKSPPFPPAGGPAFYGVHLGDLLISVPQAARQAAELGHPLETELRILLLHGILHCLGFDHEADEGTMNRVEAELRRRFVGELSFLEGSDT